MQISFIGMQVQEVDIKPSVKVTLKSDSQVIDEVIVVAYGTAKKSSFTGSAAKVDGKTLEKMQVSNLSKSLDGAVAGVQTTAESGQPGSSANIYIRGIGSILASKSPLIIVDGMPYEGSLNSINNADVESMTVLKDAAANSLYGARGSNGVILITTKKGSSGKTKITVDAKWGGNTRAVSPYNTIRNEQDYYELYWEALKNEQIYGATPMSPLQAGIYASKNMIRRLGGYNSYNVANELLVDPVTGRLNPNAQLLYHDDWLKDPYQTGLRQEYNATFSGGNEKTTFYLSLNYLGDESFVKNSDFKRYAGRVNVDHQVTSWMKVGANVSYSQTTTNYSAEAGTAGNLFSFGQYNAPIYPIWQRDANGNIMQDENGEDLLDFGVANGKQRPVAANNNPYTVIEKNVSETIIDNMGAKVFGEISFLKDFKLIANLSVDNFSTSSTSFQTPVAGDAANVNGRGTKKSQRYFVINSNQLLTWAHQYNSHSFDVLLGHETKSDKLTALSAMKEQFLIPNNPDLANGVKLMRASSETAQYRLEGFFGQLKYNFNDKYYLSASYRTDGSSRFHPDNRWGSFWSVGASWRLKEEEFLRYTDWLSDLKLKASFGTQGNDNLPNNTPYMDQYTVINQDDEPSMEYSFRGNKEITWEKSQNFNVGVEFGFWDSRLVGSAEFFIKSTKDLLYAKPLALSQGSPTTQYVNDMDMKNTGVEVELNARIIDLNSFKWNVALNLTHYKNELTKLATGKDPSGYAAGDYWRKKGGSLYDWYMVQYVGVDPNTGDALYTDLDASGNIIGVTNDPQSEDRLQIGKSTLPKIYGGLSTTVETYGFDLSVSTAFSFGGYVMDSPYSSLMGYGRDGGNWSTDIYDRWTPTHTETDVPKVQIGKMDGAVSDRFLTRADYFNLKNVVLGYTFPKNALKKLYIESLRVYAVGDNLFLGSKRTGLDPRQKITGDVSTSYYSAIRTISLGLSINF